MHQENRYDRFSWHFLGHSGVQKSWRLLIDATPLAEAEPYGDFLTILGGTTRCGVDGKGDTLPRRQDNPFLRQLPIMSTKTSLVGASSMRSRVVALSCMLIGDCNKTNDSEHR